MSDTEKITPALTPDEWAEQLPGRVIELRRYLVDDDYRHYVAALCLYGQPFGFTWEDVDRCEERRGYAAMELDQPEANRWASLCDRIAALLPPREVG